MTTLTIPAKYATYLRYRVEKICEDARMGKLDTLAPHMLSPDGPPITVTFTPESVETSYA